MVDIGGHWKASRRSHCCQQAYTRNNLLTIRVLHIKYNFTHDSPTSLQRITTLGYLFVLCCQSSYPPMWFSKCWQWALLVIYFLQRLQQHNESNKKKVQSYRFWFWKNEYQSYFHVIQCSYHGGFKTPTLCKCKWHNEIYLHSM